tara:strand:- start:3830 stop:4180 length:351 start_codon:yes stop_codon:yes gene_type:complete
VKIGNLLINSIHKIQSKKDAQDSFKEHLEQEQKKQDSEPEKKELSEEELTDAIENFESAKFAKERGIHASVTPGLRVVLSDSQGKQIRQMSGEEFLDLRTAVQEQVSQGKLIDKKI